MKALRQQFISDHLPAGSDGQVGSVCGRFGVVAAAGELATEWNILPWSTGEATQAAAICFQAWLSERGGIGAGEVQAAIRQVRAFSRHMVRRGSRKSGNTAPRSGGANRCQYEELNEVRTINRCGWRRRDGVSGHISSCRKRGNPRSVCGIDGEMAAKAMADRGLLKRDGKNLTCKVTIPEHGRPRVYVVSGALLEGDAD